MRAVGCALIIVAVLVGLYLSGVGRGLNACLADCRWEHCHGYEKDLDVNCDREAYAPCKEACYEEYGGEDGEE